MTNSERKTKTNAHRLASTLMQYSEYNEHSAPILQLATILKYDAVQLKKDMKDVFEYISIIEDN